MHLQTPSATPVAANGLASSRPKRFRVTSGWTLFISYVVLLVVFSILSPYFLTGKNFVNIGQTMAVVGIVAIGETLALLAGGVDLSVGSVAALSGVVTALLWEKVGLPIGVCALVGLGSGALVGWINGILVTRLRINPLISTLATYSAVRGFAFVLTNAQMNQLNHPQFQFLGRGAIGSVPFSLILMVVLYIVFIFVLHNTPFGREVYAVGGNPMASRLAGIATRRRLLTVFILSGLFAGLGGIISASQLAAGTPQAATGLEFTVIAAAVLGGTSLSGGKGGLIGTLIGVFILRTLDNGLILTNVSSYFQEVARGAVLILAVGFDQIRSSLEKSRKGAGG